MNIKNGQRVCIHYTGRHSNGKVFDSSVDRDSPLYFVVGSGALLPNFEKAVTQMKVGEKKSFDLTSDEAYGDRSDDAVQAIPREHFSPEMDLKAGETVTGTAPNGQPVQAKIVSIETETVTLDFNHPLAGEDISFEVEVLSVE